MAADTHALGPLVGADALGWHSTCACGETIAGATRDQLRVAHQRHAGAHAHHQGLAKARRMLAETLERGKPQPIGADQ